MFSMKDPNPRLNRWVDYLRGFDFDIVYRPGRKHQDADALSTGFWRDQNRARKLLMYQLERPLSWVVIGQMKVKKMLGLKVAGQP